MAWLDTLKKALDDFTSELGKLRRKRESLLVQREDLISAPATRADIVALLHGWVDIEREQFLKTLGHRLQREIASPPLDMLDPDAIRRHTNSNYLGIASAVNGGGVTARAVDEMFVGLLSTTAKTFIAGAVNDMAWPGEEGFPLAERRAKLAKLDAEIDALTQREAELLKAAAEARVIVD
jgi:hypothetical protein